MQCFKKISLFVFPTILMAGCSSFEPAEKPPLPVVQQQAQPLLSNYWAMKSKVGIQTPQERGSAQLSWNQQGDKYSIKLTGPLGKSLGSLVNDGTTITLTSSDGKIQTASSEEQLVLEAIGKPLPVEQLQFWIKGIKAPFHPIQPVRADEEMVEFIQKDWFVSMSSFQNLDGYKLPQKITLRFPSESDAAETEIELKLIIKGWNLPAKTAYEEY